MSLSTSFDELEKLTAVAVINGSVPVCQAQILMSYPFFSLAKAPRLKPIDYSSHKAMVHVAADGASTIPTIWDADILIWAASQVVHGQNTRQPTSRRIKARPYDILCFLGRGRSKRNYDRLRNALDRLKGARITTSLGPEKIEGPYTFSWIDGWREARDRADRAAGLEIYLSDWFYKLTNQPQACLNLDSGYFRLTGGLERWLYLLARKHGGRQETGWSFDLDYLHRKSGSLTPRVTFIRDVRNIAKRGRLLDYDLAITRNDMGKGQLSFRYSGCGQPVNSIVLMGDSTIVPSGRERSCYQVAKSPIRSWKKTNPGSPKIYSKIYSKKDYGAALDNALERLAQRRGSKAFGSGMGESAPSLRPSLPTPSQQPHKPNLINRFQPFKLFEAEVSAPLPRSTDRKIVLNELLARKKIPLPGEAS
jgi:plasmid replication initiation protein